MNKTIIKNLYLTINIMSDRQDTPCGSEQWDAAEMWRTDKENMPDNGFVLVLYGKTPMLLSGKYAKGQDVVKYWKPIPEMP